MGALVIGTADITRDEESAYAPTTRTAPPVVRPTTPAPAPPSPLAAYASSIPDLRGELDERRQAYEDTRARQVQAVQDRADLMDPKIAAAQTAIADRANLPEPTPTPTIGTPPSRRLTEFYGAIPGESPESSVNKLVNSMGLFATMAGAVSRGYAKAALAALQGSLVGWQKGEYERSALAFADWQANAQKALTEHQLERQRYEDILKASDRTIEDRLRDVKLAALKSDNQVMVAALESETADKALAHLMEQAKLDESLRSTLLKMESARQAKAEEWKKSMPSDVVAQLMAIPEVNAGGFPTTAQVQSAIAAAAKQRVEQQAAAGLEAAKIAQRTPEGQMQKMEENLLFQSYLNEIDRLMNLKGPDGQPRVRLDMVVGGLRPWVNKIAEEGKLGPIVIDPAMLPQLTPEERRFLALTNNYADRIIRQRTGAAVSMHEYTQFQRFLVSEGVTPQSFRVRLGTEREMLRAEMGMRQQLLNMGGFRAPNVTPPSLAPSGHWGWDEQQ